MKHTNWIWIPNWTAQDKDTPQIVCFRRSFHLDEIPDIREIHISADSRYKLYINSKLISIGPCKGDHRIWYYDTVNIAPWLVSGENVLAVQVLRYPLDKGNNSVFRTVIPGLYLEAGELSADGKWKCIRKTGVHLLPDSPILTPLYIQEKAGGAAKLQGWTEPGYQDYFWENAETLLLTTLAKKTESPIRMEPRSIPPMNLIPRRFSGVQCIREAGNQEDLWNEMLRGEGRVCIPAHSKEIVEINAGELMTGFLQLSLSGGAGAEIKILQAEAYYQSMPGEKWEKRNRTDWRNGQLQGMSDVYAVGGFGSKDRPEIYEPFWFRTFRFVQMEITTGADPLNMEDFSYLETGYPLEIKTEVETSDTSMTSVWDISQRTLRRCMQETYMDCPFYEQLQYVMDSRAQILYTYAVSADDRLARKCFADFRQAQRYDGMIAACYPNTNFTVIPGFAIYYILMLYDHMMYFGDKKLIRSYLPSIDGVLDWFDNRLTSDGLVDRVGGMLFHHENWSFIDWSAHWNATAGMPPVGEATPLTMESLLYILGLEHGADMADFAGRVDTAREYRQRAEKVRSAVRSRCIGSSGMLQDGPGEELYSQHCQVFGILTDVVDSVTGRMNLETTLQNPKDYAQCSVAMAFYLFRALEKSGLYCYTDQCWDVWRDMIKNDLTTCLEEPVEQRSDCHAWGALALYELPAVILGVRPTKPGFEEFEVTPVSGHFTWAKGKVITPRGMVNVQWEKKGNKLSASWELEE